MPEGGPKSGTLEEEAFQEFLRGLQSHIAFFKPKGWKETIAQVHDFVFTREQGKALRAAFQEGKLEEVLEPYRWYLRDAVLDYFSKIKK